MTNTNINRMKSLSVLVLFILSTCTQLFAAQKQTVNKDKLSVSFFSKGSGIDLKKRGEFDLYLKEFEKKERVSLAVEQIKWGREGEVDYCIDLKPISKKKGKRLVAGANLLLGNAPLVQISQTDACKKAMGR